MNEFSKFIADHRAGSIDKILGLELAKVVEATQKHKAAGSLTIKINLKAIREGETEVNIQFAKKIPQRDTFKSVMFVNKDLTLLSEDPNQLRLFDQVNALVDPETGEVIVVDGDKKQNGETVQL